MILWSLNHQSDVLHLTGCTSVLWKNICRINVPSTLLQKLLLHDFSHMSHQTNSLPVCTSCPSHTQTHMHTPNVRNLRLTVKKKMFYSHTHSVLESPWQYLLPISAASSQVQVAATMAPMITQCDLWTYIVSSDEKSQAIVIVLVDVPGVQKTLDADGCTVLMDVIGFKQQKKTEVEMHLSAEKKFLCVNGNNECDRVPINTQICMFDIQVSVFPHVKRQNDASSSTPSTSSGCSMSEITITSCLHLIDGC